MRGHGAFHGACHVCKITGLRKGNRTFYPPWDKSDRRSDDPKDYFSGIVHKDQDRNRDQWLHSSAAITKCAPSCPSLCNGVECLITSNVEDVQNVDDDVLNQDGDGDGDGDEVCQEDCDNLSCTKCWEDVKDEQLSTKCPDCDKDFCKSAVNNIFYKMLGKYLKDPTNQIMVDGMHTVELGVGRRILSQAVNGKNPSSGKYIPNLRFLDIKKMQRIQTQLTTTKHNKEQWNRGIHFQRIPSSLQFVHMWKASEFRVWWDYLGDIMVDAYGEDNYIPPKKPEGPKKDEIWEKLTKMCENDCFRPNWRGDGRNRERTTFLHTFIVSNVLKIPDFLHFFGNFFHIPDFFKVLLHQSLI